jgi:UDP-N-acetylglucosamine:LPS N-acetylglucosamine transferase
MNGQSCTLCVVCSAGGHLSEAISALSASDVPRYFVTYGEPHARARLANEEAYYVVDPHTSLVGYVKNTAQSIALLVKKRPRVIFSTGAGIALATCIFGKLMGARVIYLESGARVTTPSKTGRLAYRFANVFIVQWKPMLRWFPKALYVGPLL